MKLDIKKVNYVLRLEMNKVIVENIPAFQLLRAMGFVTDLQILRCIFSDMDDESNRDQIEIVKASLAESYIDDFNRMSNTEI
jgi:DNA-directed RNA polymerase beta subunit